MKTIISNPVQIADDEWWYKGCFIQKQIHPLLKPYHVFRDSEKQESVGTCYTFTESKKICDLNEVKDFKQGYKSFLQSKN